MDTLSLIYYSATGTTKKIVEEIADKTGIKSTFKYDITKSNKKVGFEAEGDCLAIIGLPVYGGRLPVQAVDELKRLRVKQIPAVIVVVYGNRAYDDALLELKEIAGNCGFQVLAAAAFIGEHSFASRDCSIANGRPDQKDLLKCNDFATLIQAKLKNRNAINTISESQIPGEYPYKERKALAANVYPDTNFNQCNHCGICVDVCPSGAITMNPNIETNGELCTWCCSCVKNCPNEARIFDHPTIQTIRKKLFDHCADRKEPEFYL